VAGVAGGSAYGIKIIPCGFPVAVAGPLARSADPLVLLVLVPSGVPLVAGQVVHPSWVSSVSSMAPHHAGRQLAFAARIRELFDQGHTLGAARRILDPEDLAAERALTCPCR
jgi:hypothetical protein